MTDVYVTRTGAKYHADYSCSGLLDAEDQRGHRIERWRVPLHGLWQEACAVCWPRTHGWDPWAQLEHEVERLGDSPYEGVFVAQVLRHVQGLRPREVATQVPARGASGRDYRLDFVLTASSGRQVVVEIDGTDKVPGERGIDEVQRAVDARRADLRAAGWRVLNLSNTRVASHSIECITEVEAELQEANRSWEQGTLGSSSVQGTPTGASGNTSAKVSGKWLAAAAATVLVGGAVTFALSDSIGEESPGPPGRSCPRSDPVKGNVNDSGDRIFHEPGWQYYDATWPEECFATPQDAVQAGYRESEVQRR